MMSFCIAGFFSTICPILFPTQALFFDGDTIAPIPVIAKPGSDQDFTAILADLESFVAPCSKN